MIPALAGRRVVLVLETLELGGSERQAVLHARCLADQGAAVQVVALTCAGQAARLCDDYGIPWRVAFPSAPSPSAGTAAQRRIAPALGRKPRSLQLLRWAARLALDLRREQPNIVLSYTVVPNVLCGLAWRWTGARLYVWNQRDISASSGWPGGERLALALTRCCIANSSHVAAFLSQRYRVAPAQIHVIRNGIELPAPRDGAATWRRRLDLSEDTFVAGMVANLSRLKDHQTLLVAWRQVLDHIPPGHHRPVLLLAGRYDEAYPDLRQQAADLALGDQIRFVGPVDDVAGLLQSLNLGVYSSRAEGSTNAVLEYMASGLPIVATDIPGIREALGAAGQCWLAAPGDGVALANLILKIIPQAAGLRSLGAGNRAHVEQQYSLSQMCSALTELLTTETR